MGGDADAFSAAPVLEGVVEEVDEGELDGALIDRGGEVRLDVDLELHPFALGAVAVDGSGLLDGVADVPLVHVVGAATALDAGEVEGRSR